MFFKGDIDCGGERGNPAGLIAAGFRKSGPRFFQDLAGAFAFSLEDRLGGKLYLVRDPFGKVPLYYYGKDARLHSDSVRDLIGKGVPRRLSRAGLHAYLAYGAVQDPLTLVDGVFSVPPGCFVVADAASGRVAGGPAPYWTPSFETRGWKSGELREAVAEAVRQAVAGQIVPGEDPAAFLSGGIDSSAVVAVLRRLHPGEIRTYCLVYDDPETDERRWARLAAERNGTRHTELMLTAGDVASCLPRALADYDQPSIDGLNTWFASRLMAGAGEKTALSGIGGDELFMGYGAFAKHRMAYRCAKMLKYVPAFAGRALSALAPNEKVRKLGQLAGLRTDPYYLPRRIFGDAALRELAGPGIWEEGGFPQLGHDAPEGDLLNRISWMECRTSLLSMYLRDGYQMSSANGLEIRSPLVGRRLAELLFSVPGAMKTDAAVPKPLLVYAARGGIPDACVFRAKQGFSPPFERYVKRALRAEWADFFEGGESRLFNGRALRKIKKAYDAGRVSWSRVWALYVVEEWCGRWLS